MSQLKTTFVSDKRNLGGKRDIDNLQKNHLIALINVKPSLNS
jgi:Holliday junction resolvase RusA-like endonuclease